MSNWTRERINPVEELKRRGWPTDHITYDPNMRKGDYSINRQQTHDGTMLFTMQMIEEPLALLAFRQTFHKPREKEFLDNEEGVRYVVGPMRLATVFGTVKLPCSETSKYPGQRERLRLPVRMYFANDASEKP
jgi:hypothetical protein